MGKAKLQKFAQLETFSNVRQHDTSLQGKWATEQFGNNNPIVLELACGKGEYSLALAERDVTKNFIGVDIKGNRIWTGARKALDLELSNVAFLRTFIHHIDEYFAPNEVDDIWITFPDPFLRESKAKKRLTSSRFLDLYRKILKPTGRVRLKTDSPELWVFTKETIAENGLQTHRVHENIYAECPDDDLLCGVQTYYEKKHLLDNRIIRYVEFSI